MGRVYRNGEWIAVYRDLLDEVKALEREAKALAKDERHIRRDQVINLATRVAQERAAGNITGRQHFALDFRLHELWPDK